MAFKGRMGTNLNLIFKKDIKKSIGQVRSKKEKEMKK